MEVMPSHPLRQIKAIYVPINSTGDTPKVTIRWVAESDALQTNSL